MWETMTLEKVCKIISGNSIPAKKKEEYYTDVEGMPYVATKDVGFDGAINYENGVFIPDQYLSGFKVSPAFATLVCAEGGSAGRKIAFSTEECCFVNKLFSLQPNENIIPKFIYYYTLGTEFQSQFKEAMHGLIGGVSLSKIKNFYISFPPLAEQQRIVAKLDAAFAEIDGAVEVVDAKETEVQKLKGSLLSSSLGGNAVMWKTEKLGDICENYKSDIVDGPFGANLKSEHFQSEGIPVLKIQNVKEFALNRKKMVYVTKEKYAELSRHNFRNGDLIMTKLGAPLGVTAIVNELKEGVIVADLVRIRIDETKADKRFIEYQLNSPSIRNQINSAAKGATRPRIKLSVVRDLKLQIPPLAEQQRIVAKLDAAFAEIKNANDSIIKSKANYLSLKSAILAQELQSEAA